MADPARRHATYEDLLGVAEPLIAEILDGELVTQPRPAFLHQRATSVLGQELGAPFDRGRGGPGGWLLIDEPELRLGRDVLVPDLAGWRRERLPELPDTSAMILPPDWVCEALSPATAARDRVQKLPLYARERVGHAWLIDPQACTLEVFRLQGSGWLLVGTWEGDALVRAEPFEAFELALGELWAR